MDLTELVNLIKDTGVTIGILIFFCWRDCKYMQKIEETLDIIKSFIMTGKKSNMNEKDDGR